MQIGEVNLRGMGSEQVAAVLRQSGTHVRLVVARPVEPTSPDYQVLLLLKKNYNSSLENNWWLHLWKLLKININYYFIPFNSSFPLHLWFFQFKTIFFLLFFSLLLEDFTSSGPRQPRTDRTYKNPGRSRWTRPSFDSFNSRNL